MADNLIYDRTESDIDRANALSDKIGGGAATPVEKAEWGIDLRGRWNASDLDRIEQWTRYLADLLHSYGYSVAVITKTDWVEGISNRPNPTEINRIRTNIDALQTGFYALPDWREIVYNNTMDFTQANTLEWDLQAMHDWMQRMIAHFDFVRSGENYAG